MGRRLSRSTDRRAAAPDQAATWFGNPPSNYFERDQAQHPFSISLHFSGPWTLHSDWMRLLSLPQPRRGRRGFLNRSTGACNLNLNRTHKMSRTEFDYRSWRALFGLVSFVFSSNFFLRSDLTPVWCSERFGTRKWAAVAHIHSFVSCLLSGDDGD